MISRFFLLSITLCALNSCALPKWLGKPLPKKETKPEVVPEVVAPAKVEPPPLFSWEGDGVEGTPRVRISLSEQKAQIYKGKANVGWTYVATGTSDRPTPQGTFSITEKIEAKRSNRFGVIVDAEGDVVNGNATAGVSPVPEGGRFVGASMPNWMRLTGYGIGMHGGPIPHPGRPASHGCIRLPYAMARILFSNLEVGTTVTISE